MPTNQLGLFPISILVNSNADNFVNGDTGIPAGYLSGLMVLSNRNSALTGDQIWQFYKAVTNKEWAVKSQPDTAANSFTAEFAKGSRGVIIRAYKTDYSDGTGNQVGYRVEVWYK